MVDGKGVQNQREHQYDALHPKAVAENYAAFSMLILWIGGKTVCISSNVFAGKFKHIVSKRNIPKLIKFIQSASSTIDFGWFPAFRKHQTLPFWNWFFCCYQHFLKILYSFHLFWYFVQILQYSVLLGHADKVSIPKIRIQSLSLIYSQILKLRIQVSRTVTSLDSIINTTNTSYSATKLL